MISIHWLRNVLYSAPALLVIGILFSSIASRNLENGMTEEEVKLLIIFAGIGFNGLFLVTAFLWLNEFVCRWKEGKDLGDRIISTFWLFMFSFIAAYYFSYQRTKD